MIKKLLSIILLLLLFSGLKSHSQNLSCNPGSDCGHWLDSSYTFEKAYSSIQIDTINKRNQWQIAVPHKIILDSAYSPTHALITDSINPILTNDTSIVTLKIYPDTEANIYLQFRHKYDIDSIHQKAFLQASYDNGKSWGVIGDNNQPPCNFRLGGFWTCGNSNSTIDGPYFHGTTHEWKTSAISWIWLLGERLEDSVQCKIPPSNLLIRFVFENDSVAVTNEGWMIDNIDIYYIQVCGGVNTIAKSTTSIYPNPADNYILIKNSAKLNYINITNLYGQILVSKKEQNSSSQKIDISSLIPGLYFIQYKDATGNFGEEKFIKQ